MSGFGRHLDEFGLCECKDRSGIDEIVGEEQDEWGRWRTVRSPICADCFGLL